MLGDGPRVVVAMSGGVDSSAAALMLLRQGYEVVGVAMQVWDYRRHKELSCTLGAHEAKATCCAPADFDDARRVAEFGGFAFYVFDFEGSFESQVIEPFVNSYLEGLTPNPCIECNRKIKFKELRRRAKSLGVSKVATGHYAQIKPVAGGVLGLFTSVDKTKDQSYFLFMMQQQELEETLFPVGALTKKEVRAYLLDAGIEIAQKPESQDICFVTSSVTSFIEKYEVEKRGRGALDGIKGGRFILRDGSVVGSHDGIHRYTVGQRKGLAVSHHCPLYVLEIDPKTRDIVLGPRDELETQGFEVAGVSFVNSGLMPQRFNSLVKVRYRHEGVECQVELIDEDRVRVRFDTAWTPVCPGQFAVFYSPESDADGDRQVFGGGAIQRT